MDAVLSYISNILMKLTYVQFDRVQVYAVVSLLIFYIDISMLIVIDNGSLVFAILNHRPSPLCGFDSHKWQRCVPVPV